MQTLPQYPPHTDRPAAVTGSGCEVIDFGPDGLAAAEAHCQGRRAIALSPGVYAFWGEGSNVRLPCGGCGLLAPVGTVCGCQAKPKRSCAEHVTEVCTPEVLARMGLPQTVDGG